MNRIFLGSVLDMTEDDALVKDKETKTKSFK